jgi:hypothetical protein
MRTIILKKCILIAIIISIPLTAGSQERISIPRILGEMKFDGLIDDLCWQNVSPLPMVMHTPVFGNQPSEKTEVLICYDNTYLYIGARLYDSDPAKMLISSKKRDESEVVSEELMLILTHSMTRRMALVLQPHLLD